MVLLELFRQHLGLLYLGFVKAMLNLCSFLVASLLPLDFFVSAATVTVVAFGVMSLIIFSELGFTKKILVRRTVVMSVLLIAVVLGSAQWT